MTAAMGRTRLLWLGAAGLVVLLGVTIAYLVTRPPAQAQVGGDALPTVATAHQAAVYVDCSTLDSITYDPHNPCQTFVLLQSRQFANAKELLRAEGRLLVDSGWRHSARQPVDYDATGNAMASPTASWVAGDRHVCAYVETAEAGVAAERRELSRMTLTTSRKASSASIGRRRRRSSARPSGSGSVPRIARDAASADRKVATQPSPEHEPDGPHGSCLGATVAQREHKRHMQPPGRGAQAPAGSVQRDRDGMADARTEHWTGGPDHDRLMPGALNL